MLMLREKLGIEPNCPISDDGLVGLPLPKNVWDNERSFDEGSYTDKAENWETARTG